MSMRWRFAIWCTFLFLATAWTADAQRTTGEIVGKITDGSGGVLPGVTVTLRGPSLQGEEVVVSGETGLYHLPVVPPGLYELEYMLPGFTTVKRTEILVQVGATVTLDESLKVGALEESITVSAASPVVDVTKSQVSTAYNQEWVQTAPVRRFSYFDLVNSAPGVQQNSQIGTSTAATVFGSSNNQYQIDGSPVGSSPWLNTDAVDTAEVVSLGASAEFGNVQGAVFNIVTRQGGNQLHGDLNWYYQNNSLVARNTPQSFDNGKPYHLANYRDVTGQIGGPFINDKFWFFASTEYNINNDSQPNTDPAYPARSEERRMFWKFTYSLNNNNRLLNGYHDDFYWLPSVGTGFTAPAALSRSHGHNPTPNVVYTSVLPNRTLFEGRFSGYWLQSSTDPQIDGAPSTGIRYTDGDTQYITGAISGFSENRSWTYGSSVKLSHSIDQFLGVSHDITTGIQYTTSGSQSFSGSNDSIKFFSLTLKQATGTTKLPQVSGTNSLSWGYYFDDNIRANDRVTLNLGVRYDHSRGYYPSFPLLDATGVPTGQVSAANNAVDQSGTWSPRLGINIRVMSQTVLKAHYGRYYDALPRDFSSQVPSTTATVSFNCAGQAVMPGDPLTAPTGFCADAADRSAFTTSAATNNTMDPNRRNDYTDQFIFQIEQELVKDLGLQVNYVYKKGNDLIGSAELAGTYVPFAYVDNVGAGATGNTINLYKLTSNASNRIFEVTNPSGLYSRYRGVAVALTKRMSHKWQAVVSLDVSKSETNNTTGSSLGQSPNDFIFSDGLSNRDRPIVAKAQVSYRFPWGILGAVNWQHQSGEPWRRTITVSGLGFPSAPTIPMEPYDGSRRFPSLNQADLRAVREFKLSGSRRLQVFVDMLNMFNSNKTESVASAVGNNTSFGVPTNFIPPRHIQFGSKFVW
jgi:hypothetical protein